MDRDPLTGPVPALRIGLKIGLTGGIGSGKSTVARRFAALGARVIDTDALGQALTAPGGAAIAAIAAAFGSDMITAEGAMDRARMRTVAFADPAERRRLEAILHPMIGAATQEAAAAAAPGQAIVFDVPLLVESAGWRARVDRIVVVDCTTAMQVERVMRRSGWAAEVVERTIAQQATRERRRAVADAVIFNEGVSLEGLEAEVDRLWANWGLAGASRPQDDAKPA